MIREWKDDAEIAKTAGAHARAVLRPAPRRRAGREPRLPRHHAPRVVLRRARHGVGGPWRRPRRRNDVAHRARLGDAVPPSRGIPTRSAINGGSVYQLEFAERERELAGRPARPRRRGAPLLLGRPAPDVRAAPRRALPAR
ncbi:MAG: hypothetical protein MZV64_43160 [Ignavibacteriales bacterium]|nr:hypothetical protein [Ignavibacteriales bacterium]